MFRRRKKFPFMATLVAAVLTVCVASEIKANESLAADALGRIGAAGGQLLNSVALLTGSSAAEESFTFSNGGVMTVPETPAPEAATFTDSAPAEEFPAQSAENMTPAATPEPMQDAVPLLVNASNPLPDGYVPDDLVMMRDYCDESIVYIKGSEIQGCRTAVDALLQMLSAARAEGLTNWQISAGYRSIAYQQKVMNNKIYEYRQQGMSGTEAQKAAQRYVAMPGCSEHHTGLAFDITVIGKSFANTAQCKWLHEHCWAYGFILRYPEDKEGITGIAAEAWHFRYVGQPHAQIMKENNWCLEEYIQTLG